MTSDVHFISGLPRSGSTLLSALLRQNPRVWASVSSPVATLWGELLPRMSGKSEYSSFFDDERRGRILKGIFDGYYGPDRRAVVFDTNRSWTARAPIVHALYPDARIVCCVRDVSWVIDSVERVVRRNPLQMSRIFGFKPGASVYARADVLMDQENGLVGAPWSALREAWFSELADRLIVVNYDSFTRDPRSTMSKLYAELGEAAFEHDFENIEYDEPDYDEDLGTPGLHRVRSRVEPAQRPSCLPPDIFAKYADANFWARPEYQGRGVTVL